MRGFRVRIAVCWVGALVVSTSTASALITVGAVDTPGSAQDVEIAGDFAYVADWMSGFQVIDISNPTSPVIVGTLAGGELRELAVAGNLVYAADSRYGSGGLRIIDVSDPASPTVAGHRWASTTPRAVAVAGDFAYVAGHFQGLVVVDVSDLSTQPIPYWYQLDTPGQAYDVEVVGNLAYLADGTSGLRVIDISEPTAPVEIGALDTPNEAFDVELVGHLAYVADSYGGLRVIDVSNPTAPVEIGAVSVRARAVDVRGDRAYVAGLGTGLHVIDISDPASPVEINTFLTARNAVSVEVEGNLAYIGDAPSGLRVVDVSRPDYPKWLGTHATPGIASSIEVRDDVAYVADGATGMLTIDVADPAAPVDLDALDTPDFAWGITLAGDRAYLSDSESGLRVIDVSNPAALVELGAVDTPGEAFAVDVVGDYAYLADWTSGLRVIEVSDPANSTEVGALESASLGGAVEVDVADGLACVADWDAGVRVVDVSDPTTPQEIAGFNYYYQGAGDVEIVGGVAYWVDLYYGLHANDIAGPWFSSRGHFELAGFPWTLELDGGLAYLGASRSTANAEEYDHSIRVIDISNPASMWEVGDFALGTSDWASGPYVMSISNGVAYVVSGAGGIQIVDFGPEYAALPEPSGWSALATGVATLALLRARRKRRVGRRG